MNTPEVTSLIRDALPYEADEQTLRSLDAWQHSYLRPDLFVVAPTIRDVGESELVERLARASYDLQGFRDSRRRHFIARAFPHRGSEFHYARFIDEPFDASEITDGFYGVDAIDLSAWIGADLDLERADWRRLLDYVADHPETDFVFLAYTDDPSAAGPLVSSIRQSCAIAVEVIELGYPTREGLAQSFLSQCRGEYEGLEGRILEGIDQLRSHGAHPNHSFVKSCALSSLHELALMGDAREALDRTFERFETVSPTTARTRRIGF